MNICDRRNRRLIQRKIKEWFLLCDIKNLEAQIESIKHGTKSNRTTTR